MCGRFTLVKSTDEVLKHFDVEILPDLFPRENIAPTQGILAIRRTAEGRREGRLLRWGLIPSWTKEMPRSRPLINARGETVNEKPSFRKAFLHRRCLLPADGYYEWKEDDGKKKPFHVHFQDHRPFAMAGLHELWRNPETGDPLESCTIITTEAAPDISSLHDRMPVILPKACYEAWLNPATPPEELLSMLRPWQGHDLEIGTASLK
ncbi:MAG: SOS response-associated peptidase [Gemmataceae bacterium]